MPRQCTGALGPELPDMLCRAICAFPLNSARPPPRMKDNTVSNLWRRLKRQVSLKRHKPVSAQPPVQPLEFVPRWPSTDSFYPLCPKPSLFAASPSIAFDPPPKPPLDPKHNAELISSSLPPEIVAEIFLLVCEASFLQDSSWIACSHVCSFWRQIALDTPLLWAHAVFKSRAWVDACLERSKSSLLIVGADTNSNVEPLVREVLQKTERIGRIQLTVSIMSETLWTLLAGPFPHLTYLSIEGRIWGVPWGVPMPLHPDVAPFPALRSLLLSTNASYLPPLPSQLVSLEIYCTDWPVPWHSLSQALEQLEQLRVLKLLGFSAPASPFRKISLPELRDLHLSNTPANCTAFMESLDCAKLRRFNLHLTSFEEIGNLYRALSARVPKPPKCMNLSRDKGWSTGGNDVFLKRFPSSEETASVAFTYANERWPRDVFLDICLSWSLPDVRADITLAKIFVALPELGFLEHVEWLWVNDWNTIPQVLWRPVLRRLEGLLTLAAHGSPPAGLFWNLVSHLETGDAGDAPLLLPSLRMIKLINVNCAAGNWLPPPARKSAADPDALPVNSYFDLDNTRFLDLLVCYLELRPAPLPRLAVWECFSYTGSEIKLLRRLVEEVIWDGRGLTTGEYSSNGDEAGALTISHMLIARQKGYEELNVSEEDRWREEAEFQWEVRPSTRMSDRLYDGDPETEK